MAPAAGHVMPANFPHKAVQRLEERIKPYQEKLASHPLYKAVQNVDQLRLFMENHVFAVWDFMSLLKSLQLALTCVEIPWTAKGYRESRRLINEIILGEGSDFVAGQNISHLELYLDSMTDAGANTKLIEKGLGGSAEEAAIQVEWMVRKSLKSPYSMVATDKKKTYAFSLIQIRHRDSNMNRLSFMEKRPDRTPNFSLLWDVCDKAEQEFWKRESRLNKIALLEVIYVASDVRRHGIGKTMLETQMELLKAAEKTKNGNNLDGIMAVATSSANKKQLAKQGFKELFTLSPELYRRPNGEAWKSADPELPYASVIFKKL